MGDLAILGVVTGLIIVWFDQKRYFLAVFSCLSYVSFFFHILPTLIVAGQLEKRKTPLAAFIYSWLVTICLVVNAVMPPVAWLMEKSWDSTMISFAAINGIGFFLKSLNLYFYGASLRGSDRDDNVESLSLVGKNSFEKLSEKSDAAEGRYREDSD